MKTEQKTWRFTRQTMDKHQAVKCSLLSCEDFFELLRSAKAKKATQRLRICIAPEETSLVRYNHFRAYSLRQSSGKQSMERCR